MENTILRAVREVEFELPREIWEKEILRHVEQSSIFIFRQVCRSFYNILKDINVMMNPLEDMCLRGCINVVKWDREHKPSTLVSPRAFSNACRSGNLELVEYLHPLAPFVDIEAVQSAIDIKSHDIIRFLWKVNAPVPAKYCYDVAKAGDVNLLKLLVGELSRRADLSEAVLLKSACLSGSMEVIEYVLKRGQCKIDTDAVNAFASIGRLDLIKWAIDQGADPHSYPFELIYSEAVILDSVEILDYLFENKFQLSSGAGAEAIKFAFLHGSIKSLEWLRLHCVNFFHSIVTNSWNGLYSSENIPNDIALELLKIGLKAGLSLTKSHYTNAIRRRSPSLISFLESKNCPIDYENAVLAAIRTEDLEMVKDLEARMELAGVSNSLLLPARYHSASYSTGYCATNIEMVKHIVAKGYQIVYSPHTFGNSTFTRVEDMSLYFTACCNSSTALYVDGFLSSLLDADTINYTLLEYLLTKTTHSIRHLNQQSLWDAIERNFFRLNNRVKLMILNGLEFSEPLSRQRSRYFRAWVLSKAPKVALHATTQRDRPIMFPNAPQKTIFDSILEAAKNLFG